MMTARDRRVLLWGGAVVLLAVAGRVAREGQRLAARRVDEARQAAGLAARAKALVAEAPARQRLVRERAREMVTLAPLLLSGSSDADAAAALAGELNALAAGHRVALARLDPVPDSAAGPFSRIELRLQAEGDLAGLYGFIHAVETGPLLLSFTDLAITAQDAEAAVERLRLEGAVRGWTMRRTGMAEKAEGGAR
jgi:hypothetical protein